jgi:hypothetical protein
MSYTNYDLTSAASRIQSILSGLPLNTQNFKSSAVAQYGTSAASASSQGDAARTQAERETTAQYVQMTDVMAQMNEALNANIYIIDGLIKELMRVGKLDDNAKRGIYKVRQEFMLVSYMTEYYKFMTNMVMYTLVVTLILLSLTAAWRMKHINDILYYVVTGILFALYAVSMFVLFKHAAYRRMYQWNKYYWKISGEVKRETENIGSGSSDPATCEAAYRTASGQLQQYKQQYD